MTVRIGIIGAGGMAAYHIAGFRAAAAEVSAVADPNAAAARKTAEANGIPRTYPSAEAMLSAEPGLDAVSVITPNAFHKPLTLQALKAGKNVFCEKPPALNAKEIKEMDAAARAAKRMLMFNFNNRARPESYAMMAYIRGGATGRINSAQALWIRRTGIPGFGGWFTTKALSGGGPAIDLLHMIDLALYFMNYPEPEWALARTYDDFITDKSFKGPWGLPDIEGGTTDVEAAAHGFVTFKGGQALFLRTSWAEMNRREEVSVTFQGKSGGGLVQRLFRVDGVDSTATDRCELYTHEHGRPVNRDIVTPSDESMGRIRAATNFVLALEGREAPLNTPAEAIALMTIIDAIYASSQLGAPVRMA